jgi:hypothetical protein
LFNGLRKNKVIFFGVDAPAWQGAKAQDASAYEKVKLFLREP